MHLMGARVRVAWGLAAYMALGFAVAEIASKSIGGALGGFVLLAGRRPRRAAAAYARARFTQDWRRVTPRPLPPVCPCVGGGAPSAGGGGSIEGGATPCASASDLRLLPPAHELRPIARATRLVRTRAGDGCSAGACIEEVEPKPSSPSSTFDDLGLAGMSAVGGETPPPPPAAPPVSTGATPTPMLTRRSDAVRLPPRSSVSMLPRELGLSAVSCALESAVCNSTTFTAVACVDVRLEPDDAKRTSEPESRTRSDGRGSPACLFHRWRMLASTARASSAGCTWEHRPDARHTRTRQARCAL